MAVGATEGIKKDIVAQGAKTAAAGPPDQGATNLNSSPRNEENVATASKRMSAKVKTTAVQVNMIQSGEIKGQLNSALPLTRTSSSNWRRRESFNTSIATATAALQPLPTYSSQFNSRLQRRQRASQTSYHCCRRDLDRGSLPVHHCRWTNPTRARRKRQRFLRRQSESYA